MTDTACCCVVTSDGAGDVNTPEDRVDDDVTIAGPPGSLVLPWVTLVVLLLSLPRVTMSHTAWSAASCRFIIAEGC